jgi:hypothetical protein
MVSISGSVQARIHAELVPDVTGGVFLMMFTIPDGRVHVEPITAKDAATTA